MEDVCCPCSFCGYEFEGAAIRGGDGDQDDICAAKRCDHAEAGDMDDGERDVSGVTLRFICENERLWLRIALLVKHFEASDNMSPCRRVNMSVWEGEEGGKEESRKAAMMRKERDVSARNCQSCADHEQWARSEDKRRGANKGRSRDLWQADVLPRMASGVSRADDARDIPLKMADQCSSPATCYESRLTRANAAAGDHVC